MALINGDEYKIQENIIEETSILKYLSNNNAPNGLAKFIDSFDDDQNYFLVMEHGGDGLFEFVMKAHKLINQGLLSIAEWQRFCKMAFKQMVDVIDWLHNKMKLRFITLLLNRSNPLVLLQR